MKKQSTTLKTTAALAVTAALATGCASPLTSSQSRELQEYEAKGLVVEEKNVTVATALGVLPGIGSFYTGNYGPGVVNFLFWPASIMWDPVSGYNGARTANYFATEAHVEDLRTEAFNELDGELQSGEITQAQYVEKRREIRNKY